MTKYGIYDNIVLNTRYNNLQNYERDNTMIDLTLKLKSIRHMIDYTVKHSASRIAFRIKQKNGKEVSYKDVTYSKMGEDIRAFSTWLLNSGISSKRIVVVGENSYEWVLGYLSTLASGNIFVPLDKNLPEGELMRLLERAEPECIIYGENFKTYIQNYGKAKFTICMKDEIYSKIDEGNNLIKNGDNSYDNVVIDENEMAILLFTSGTTSESKAVMLSQYNIASNINDLVVCEKFYEEDINLALLPMHHVFGLVAMSLFLRLGMMNVFCEGLRVAKALKEYKVSVLVVVPLILESMFRQIDRTVKKQGKQKVLAFGFKLTKFLSKFGIDIRKKIFVSIHNELGGNLRFIISGGAALRGDLEKWFNDIGILTVQGYGLSETSPVVSAENDTHMKYGSIGIPMPSVQVKIDNPNEDGIGEIIVKGDNVMLGYWNEPELTNEVLKGGWFYTGDMGYIDNDGYIFITGRKKDVIVLSNGKNVFPTELEQVVGKAEFVTECLVFEDEPDTLAVNVVYDESLQKNMSVDDINKMIKKHIENVNEKLVSYKRIKTVYASILPMVKTSTAKIKRIPSIEKIKKEQTAI